MTFLRLTAAAAALLVGTSASAATFIFTEGNRATIDSSTVVTNDGTGTGDTAGGPPGFVLGTLNSGDDIELHGRIIEIDDRYTFTATAGFNLEWIFGGYQIGGVQVDQDRSGFSGVPAPGPGDNTSDITLTNLGTLDVTSGTFTTDINQTNTMDENIFAGRFAAGTYELFIDGGGPFDALYDIRISAVPLPAGAVLLLTGLAGLRLARRKS